MLYGGLLPLAADVCACVCVCARVRVRVSVLFVPLCPLTRFGRNYLWPRLWKHTANEEAASRSSSWKGTVKEIVLY